MNDSWGLFSADYVSPDGHDYGTLEGIYEHLDGSGGGGGSGSGKSDPPRDKKPHHHHCASDGPGNANGDFGKAVGHDDKGKPNQFEKDLDAGGKKATFGTWAD